MKCDKLKPYTYDDMIDGDADTNIEYYPKSDADAAIAELKHTIDELVVVKKSAELILQNLLDCGLIKEWYFNGKFNAVLKADDPHLKIAELKQKLENAKATAYAESVDAGMRERRLCRAVWLARAERYKIKEFVAREEGNLSNQMSWSRILRERTYNQWVDQLLRIANLANKLQNKCLAKAEEYK